MRARRKGKDGELEAARMLGDHGLEVRRTPNSGGLAWRGDLQGLEGFCIEVKRQETLAIPAWLRQAHAAARGGEVPVVMFRRSAGGNGRERAPDTLWHVIEPADSWARRVALERAIMDRFSEAELEALLGTEASPIMRDHGGAGSDELEPGGAGLEGAA